jgi:hypothetical protein
MSAGRRDQRTPAARQSGPGAAQRCRLGDDNEGGPLLPEILGFSSFSMATSYRDIR